nr:MAG TPA: hypothetical protein [Caudoviricetes sp.]
MKFDSILLIFTLVYAIVTRWSRLSSILVIIASLYMLSNTVPKIRRYLHETKTNKK